jgi:hypothetical protein
VLLPAITWVIASRHIPFAFRRSTASLPSPQGRVVWERMSHKGSPPHAARSRRQRAGRQVARPAHEQDEAAPARAKSPRRATRTSTKLRRTSKPTPADAPSRRPAEAPPTPRLELRTDAPPKAPPPSATGYIRIYPDISGDARWMPVFRPGLAQGSAPLDQIGQCPPGQDPLSWKIFDHTCEQYSTIKDQGITDRPQTGPGPARNQQRPSTPLDPRDNAAVTRSWRREPCARSSQSRATASIWSVAFHDKGSWSGGRCPNQG